jgi:hypothetical protein
VDDLLALDFDDLNTDRNVAHITFVCDEQIDVSGDKTVSFKFVQCIDDFGCFDGSDTFGGGREGWMVGWDDGSEEGDFSDALGDEFECIAIDEKCFRFLIDLEIENLLKKRVSYALPRKSEKRRKGRNVQYLILSLRLILQNLL